jgi:type I restriction-modification system DNA methylase subunit
MNNLKIMRRTLIDKIKMRLDKRINESVNVIAIVHGLLSRSILIKYLEERKDSNMNSVFPQGFYAQFSKDAESYTDILKSKEATYALFGCLENKFNGDMLPLVENEINVICEDDLRLLRMFLLGDTELENKQLALWPLYSFDVIPIQLISSIYELFFHLSDTEEDDRGTYYTPLHLVDTLMDEVYPWEGTYSPITFMDPSCGSGIFLVEAYRRLVCRWMQSNNISSISNDELTELLESSIFGVDINEEAVRVASFSLRACFVNQLHSAI